MSELLRPIISDPIAASEIELLKHIQRVLHCEDTGLMDETTRLHIRGFQRMMGLRVHGAVDQKTVDAIEEFSSPAFWEGT